MDQRTATSPPKERQLFSPAARRQQVNVDARAVSDRFEVFVSERVLGWLPRIRSESELPYPKAVIQAVLRAAVVSARDDSERSRWKACLVELEYFLPDRELEPYWAALEHERECIRLMGRVNLEHSLDRPNGLSPEVQAAYERHVVGAAALRPLRDRIAAAVAVVVISRSMVSLASGKAVL
jgi:hypothetical protein